MPKDKDILKGVRAVVFDLDGTLVTSELDFDRIRAEAGVPAGIPVLEFIDSAQGTARDRALAVLLEHEDRAARQCALLPGAQQTLERLRSLGLKLALLTRNSRVSVQHVLSRFGIQFDCWVAREDARPKPSPEPVLKIAAALGLRPDELLVVGDYVFDVEAGRAAGARTALVHTNKKVTSLPQADLILKELAELLDHFPARCTSSSPQETP
jgi:HAD superfamily hydrolase (TIGR01509 family)